MSKTRRNAKPKPKAKGFKSGLERRFAELLLKHGVKAQYEADRLKFVRMSTYLPDWKVHDGLYIETKGYFSPRNRGDLLSFREQHPSIEIFLVFQAPSNKLNKNSKTTYGEWATQHGFRWCGINDPFPIQLFTPHKDNKKKHHGKQNKRNRRTKALRDYPRASTSSGPVSNTANAAGSSAGTAT